MRLIDADALIKYMCNHCGASCNLEDECCSNVDAVENQPTIGSEPVKHGRWRGVGMGDYSCSICGEEISGNYHNYCPNCGADMRERKET